MIQTDVYWVISGWDGDGQFQVAYITHERRVNNHTAARLFACKRLGLQDVSVSKRQQKSNK